MNSLSQDLRTRLVALGLGVDGSTSPGGSWPIFKLSFPDTPDSLISLTDSGGPTPTYLMDDTTVRLDRCQVRVRATDYETAQTKTAAIVKALCVTSNLVIGNTHYWSISESGSFAFLTMDAKRRSIWVANIVVRRQQTN